MQEPSDRNRRSWVRPLKGWRWLAAWAIVVACLAVVARLVLRASGNPTAMPGSITPWVISLGIAFGLVIFLALLVRCFTGWEGFKRLLVMLGVGTLVVALFYTVENVRGRLAWNRFKSHWEAKGEKFEFTEFIPPPVPADQNFALTPVVASSYGHLLDPHGHVISPANTNWVNRLQMPVEFQNDGPTNRMGDWQKGVPSDLEAWQRYYRNVSLTTNYFPVAPQPQAPATDVLLALSRYDSTIEDLRKAAALPESRYPLNYDHEEVFSILLPHLASTRSCANVLRLRSLAELEGGQSEAALDDVRLALQLTEKIRSEPFLISHLVRIAMVHLTMQPVWEGIVFHRWTAGQLAALQEQLSGFDFLADYHVAMRSERALLVASAEFLRRHREQFTNLGAYDGTGQAGSPAFAARWIPSGWFYQNQLRGAEFLQERMLPVADMGPRTFSPAAVKQAEESLEAMRLSPYNLLAKQFLPALGDCARKFAFAQSTIDLARLACALERCRLAQGEYPERLEALVPQFLATVPHDVIGGQSLLYRTTDDGKFIAYSVGWNAVDDGGIVALTAKGAPDHKEGDWVWRFPDVAKP